MELSEHKIEPKKVVRLPAMTNIGNQYKKGCQVQFRDGEFKGTYKVLKIQPNAVMVIRRIGFIGWCAHYLSQLKDLKNRMSWTIRALRRR